MPEIRECIMHYKHTHYVLVEQLGLGQTKELLGLFADSTDGEAGISSKKLQKSHTSSKGLTDKHRLGYLDQIDTACNITRGQKSHQTRIWPGTEEKPEILDGLILSGLSHTPRSLILKFGRLDLQGLDLQV